VSGEHHRQAHAPHAPQPHPGHEGRLHTRPVRLAASATLHCLIGCAIGELAGLMIASALGLGIWATVGVATLGGYASGFTLGLWPLVRDGRTWGEALRLIWLGEAISIGVMELAMNAADYLAGGMQAASLLDPAFWLGYAVALPAGFVAAWPVNLWLLTRGVKEHCH